MGNENFENVVLALSNALYADFRGFLSEGVNRIVVPDEMLHIQIAFQEMANVPGWTYESGVGQNPIIEFMDLKKAIYITKIKDEKTGEYHRNVGILTDSYAGDKIYKGNKMKEYEVLRLIAIGMGYDVDEYTLLERTVDSAKTPVSIVTFKGEINVRRYNRVDFSPKRDVSLGDRPIVSNGVLYGFISNGKFYNIHHYQRYSDLSLGSNDSSISKKNK